MLHGYSNQIVIVTSRPAQVTMPRQAHPTHARAPPRQQGHDDKVIKREPDHRTLSPRTTGPPSLNASGGGLFVCPRVNGLSMMMQLGASDPGAPGRIRTADTRFRRGKPS